MSILDSILKSAADSAKYAIDDEVSDMTREAVHNGVRAVKKGVGDAVKKPAQESVAGDNSQETAAKSFTQKSTQSTADANATLNQTISAAQSLAEATGDRKASADNPMLDHDHFESMSDREKHAAKNEYQNDAINGMNDAFGDMLKTEDKERLHEADEVITRAEKMVESGQSEDGSEVLYQNDDGTTPTDQATQMKNMVKNMRKMSALDVASTRVQTAIVGDGLAKASAHMAETAENEEEKKAAEALLHGAGIYEAAGDLAADTINEKTKEKPKNS